MMRAMTSPHSSARLEQQLAGIAPELKHRLHSAGFDQGRFLGLAATLTEGDAAERRRQRNAVKGEVSPPPPGSIVKLPAAGTPEYEKYRALGEAALERGELAFCTMAGGMATRMGGIVKALAEVFPGHTFLSMRLAENKTASDRAGRAIPLWLMTSDATDHDLREALKKANAPAHVQCFMQDLSLRLTPSGELFFGADNEPSTHATGHGDLIDALRRSGLLGQFLDNGGKYVWITNVDNLGASIDDALLGFFVEQANKGIDVQCEVCPKAGDKGGIPVHAEGNVQVLEEFRLPPNFDPKTVNVFNTNTFLVRAEPIAKAPLKWTYFEVEKKVDDKPAIQFERLVQEITAHLPSLFVEVPREGVVSRFLPVKDFDELARRRADIEAVARVRGML
jgi:UTP--glucose-1-phosphate uridylyltransferase